MWLVSLDYCTRISSISMVRLRVSAKLSRILMAHGKVTLSLRQCWTTKNNFYSLTQHFIDYMQITSLHIKGDVTQRMSP